jgi:chromosomal replication initiation ATPase DnaA
MIGLSSSLVIRGRLGQIPLKRGPEEQWPIRLLQKVNFKKLLIKVGQYYEIGPENLKAASKESAITTARTLLCCLAVRKLMISCAGVARALNISPATVSQATSRGAKLSNLELIQKSF